MDLLPCPAYIGLIPELRKNAVPHVDYVSLTNQIITISSAVGGSSLVKRATVTS